MQSFCWADVTVEDKSCIEWDVPADQNLSFDCDDKNFSSIVEQILANEDAYYFTISGAGICESASVEGSASGSFDNCGNGVITRT